MSQHKTSRRDRRRRHTVNEDGSPDVVRATKLARYLVDNGCDGLNVLGTTGEATSFSLDERKRVMSAYRGQAAARPHDGRHRRAATADAVALTRYASELGFAGALVLPPFYYKGVPDDGLVAYIDTIVKATAQQPIPIYLYHYPQQSGLHWHVALVRRLLDTFGARIVGLKDSSGDMNYARDAAAISKSSTCFPPPKRCCSMRAAAPSPAASRQPPTSTPTSANWPGSKATRGLSMRPSPSANCSMASRWFPA